MKLNISALLLTLAAAQAKEKASKLRRGLQEISPIDFMGPGCVDFDPDDGGWTSVHRNDDGWEVQDMGIEFPWLDGTRSRIYINNNGNLSFGSGLESYNPTEFTSTTRDLIAPFWADVDTNGNEDGYVHYKTLSDGRFVVVWDDVAHYGETDTGDDILRNTFQVVLSDASYTNDRHICFCYHDMEWVVGTATNTGFAQVGIAGGDDYFNLAQFSLTDSTWNGVESSGNGVQYLVDKGWCFDATAITLTPTEQRMCTIGIGLPDTPTDPPRSGSELGTGGDPHITTWKNEHFEYHGQCDLTLVKDAEFADGLGLDIQIRTKLVRYWSYIKNVAIKIGNDILEIQGSPDADDDQAHYWINFEHQGELDTFAGFPVTQKLPSVYKRRYSIDLSSKYPGQSIDIELYKEFVRVRFSGDGEAFSKTVGLMGDFETGKTLARDGVTEIHDFTEFGDEWQVIPSEPKLFKEVSHPQFPELCIKPEDPRGERKRRLAESNISIEEAEAACSKLNDPLTIKDCVYDILATQDMDMVGAF